MNEWDCLRYMRQECQQRCLRMYLTEVGKNACQRQCPYSAGYDCRPRRTLLDYLADAFRSVFGR